MKNIVLLFNIFALCLLASCNPNEYSKFNDNDAFVAFDQASFSIAENGGTLKVPVTLASIKGIAATVTVKGIDGTAKEGVDYTILNGGKLSFDAQNRTLYAEVQIIERAGEYTGDLAFVLTFADLGGVNAGNRNGASVTINDNDHPLASILGPYTCSGLNTSGQPISFQMEILKDASDVTKVWFYDIMGNPSWAGMDIIYYGVVNSDKTHITVPLGQESEYLYGGSTPVTLVGLFVQDGSLYLTADATLAIDVVLRDGGFTFTYPEPLIGYAAYIMGAGGIGMVASELEGVKN